MRTEQHRVSAEGNVPGATPADVVLRGRSVETTASDPATGILDAGKLYDQALRLDPSYVPALVARIDNLDRLIYATRPGREERDRIVSTMDELSRRAIAVDESYAGAWYARALALYWQGRMQEALEANARYDRLLPTRALPLNQRAWFMLASGRAEEAVALVDQALARPSKGAPEESFALATRCAIDVRLARYDDAIADCRKAMTVQNYDFADMLLLAAYAQKGDMNDAAAVKERVLKRRPEVSISSEREMLTSSNPVFLEQTEQNFFEGLRKAGIREQ
jgi:tetratricopeptide (TPR) repeat protein